MYEFERLVICRELRVLNDGRVSYIDASYEFGASVRYLFVVGRVSAPQWKPDLTFNLSVLFHGTVPPDQVYSENHALLHPARPGQPRLLIAGFPVSGRLIPGYHDAVVTFPGFDPVAGGFNIA